MVLLSFLQGYLMLVFGKFVGMYHQARMHGAYYLCAVVNLWCCLVELDSL